MVREVASWLVAVLALSRISAAEPASARADVARSASKSLVLALVAEEEGWEFRPAVGRIDPFYDREAMLKIDRAIRSQALVELNGPAPVSPGGQRQEILAWAVVELQRIESLVVQRHYEDALKIADAALKRLDRFAAESDIAQVLSRISVFRGQALEALIRNEAQAAFDALGLRIDGILWTESAARLAIVRGEPRAVGVNDRVRDCTVINIDTDRVDFRFHYKSARAEKSRRFEFPRYVGEESKSSPASVPR